MYKQICQKKTTVQVNAFDLIFKHVLTQEETKQIEQKIQTTENNMCTDSLTFTKLSNQSLLVCTINCLKSHTKIFLDLEYIKTKFQKDK